MAKLIFENLTLKEAEALASWYEGQGEQDYSIWDECQDEPTGYLYVDVNGLGIETFYDTETVVVHIQRNN